MSKSLDLAQVVNGNPDVVDGIMDKAGYKSDTMKNFFNSDSETVNTVLSSAGFSSGLGFKNRIINGDFQVNQRSKFGMNNDGGYTFDRVFCQVDSGDVRQVDFSPKEIGDIVDSTDPFGDGSLLHYWKMDGNFNDSVGDITLTSHGDVTTTDSEGLFGYTAVFDGDGDYLSSDYTDSNYWISMFIKLDNYDDYQFLLDTRSNDGEDGLVLLVRNNSIVVGSENDNIENQEFFVNGVYYKGGEDFSIYLDNISGGDIIHIVLKTGKNTNFTLGSRFTGDYNVKGYIFNVQIFNRALTDDEVKQLYFQTSQIINKKYSLTTTNFTDVDLTGTNALIPYEYRFEGQHLADLALSGSKVTVSFDFQASDNGDYSIALSNRDEEFIIKKFSYNGSGLPERIAVTFDLSEFETEPTLDENLGFILRIASQNDGDYKVNEEGKYTDKALIVDGCVKFTNKLQWCSIKDVQLEQGEYATEFERLPYELQLDRCLRYYETTEKEFESALSYSGTSTILNGWLKVKKRVKPLITFIMDNQPYDGYTCRDTFFFYWTGADQQRGIWITDAELY